MDVLIATNNRKDQGGAQLVHAPPKIGKNMIFLS